MWPFSVILNERLAKLKDLIGSSKGFEEIPRVRLRMTAVCGDSF
jgi:hypothetical protein